MGFRLRHLISLGAPEGNRSTWSQNSAPVLLDPGDAGTGVVVYSAPVWSPYDTLGENPDGSPTNIATVKGIYVVADKHVAAAAVASDITFSLYRAGAQVGGTSAAHWASGANPDFPLGVPVLVPFTTGNTALLPVPALGQPAAVTATSALLPMQPGDCILATAGTVALLVNLLAFVDAQ